MVVIREETASDIPDIAITGGAGKGVRRSEKGERVSGPVA
jgi:hypothetical protein